MRIWTTGWSLRTGLALVGTVCLIGCGGGGGDKWTDKRPKTVNVSGVVVYKQQPVAGANVVFHPQAHEHGAAGVTDSSGRFTLRTFDANDGAVPGEFKVTVTKIEIQGTGAEDAPAVGETVVKETMALPAKYADQYKTDLTVTVRDGGEGNVELVLND